MAELRKRRGFFGEPDLEVGSGLGWLARLVTRRVILGMAVMALAVAAAAVLAGSGSPERAEADLGPNLALGKPAIVSSIEFDLPVFAAAGAVDGDLGTRWSSNYADGEWLEVDLGQRYDIGRVMIHWEVAYARSYRIEVSDDREVWSEIYATAGSDGELDAIVGLSGAGRYIRLVGVQRGTQWGVSPWEFEVYGPAAPVDTNANLALGKPTQTSSVEGLFEDYAHLVGAGAVDGDPGTRWSSDYADGEWLEVDLGDRYDIGRAVIHWEVAYARAYRIEVSNDRETWSEIYTTATSDGGVDEISGLSGAGRYVRLVGVERGTGWGVSPWEFELYGQRAGSVVIVDPAPQPEETPPAPEPTTPPTTAPPAPAPEPTAPPTTAPPPTTTPPTTAPPAPPPTKPPAPEPVGAQAGPWSQISVYNFNTCLGFEGGQPAAGAQLVDHPCDSGNATDGRFVRLGDHGYGQVQFGSYCLVARSDALGAPVVVDNCGTGTEFQWVPTDWRWSQTSAMLRSRATDLCISRGPDNRFVQALCNPTDDRSQLFSDNFAAGVMARDRSMTPVNATFHGTLNFNSFHEGAYPMDSWTYGDIAFYAPPGDISQDQAREYLAWYSHMDGLHRRVWNQDNFDSVYRANDPNHGRKKVTAIIDIGRCSCGSKQQAEILGFKDWIIEDPSNWMYHWVMFYEMNRGGPTPNFYARATWPNTHQGGLILPHMMAALAFYEIGGPAGLERDVPGDFLRSLTAWEYDPAKPSLDSQDIPADIQMGILVKILQERGTDTFIQTLHNMAAKPDATNATQALCDFRSAVNESTGGAYDGRMTNDWRLPTGC